jgi:hypothetical protein
MTAKASRRVGFIVCVVLALCLTRPRVARADDAACFAANELEIGLRKQEKLRAALSQLALCGAPDCPSEVRLECERRALALNAAIPTIVVSAADGVGSDLSAVTVTLDGAPFTTVLDGRAVAVDPGSHTLHFEAKGRLPLDKAFVARENEKGRHIDVVLVAPGEKPRASAPAPGTWSTQKTLALVSGGIGVVAIGVGAAFGAISFSDASSRHSACSSAAVRTVQAR